MMQERTRINWNALVDAIKQEKCVLCIGPGVFTDQAGIKLEQQVHDYLDASGELDKDITCYPDGLFHFHLEAKRNNVLADLQRFYKGDFPQVEKLYRRLVHIPFHLILFLTPDTIYADIAKNEGVTINTDFYFKQQSPRKEWIPRISHPIAYNLFGSFVDDESVILSYDDLYDMIRSLLAEQSMSKGIDTAIHEARHFICIGLPFDKWYMQLLLRILEIHTNRRLTKYALDLKPNETEVKSFFEDQFNITFVTHEIDEFITQVSEICAQNDVVRATAETQQAIPPLVRKLIEKNELEAALDVLAKVLLEQKRMDTSAEDMIAHIRRRLRMNKTDYTKGIIPDSVHNLERTRLADDILRLLNLNFQQS